MFANKARSSLFFNRKSHRNHRRQRSFEELELRQLLTVAPSPDFASTLVNPANPTPLSIDVVSNDVDSSIGPFGVIAGNLAVDHGATTNATSGWTVTETGPAPNNLTTNSANVGDVQLFRDGTPMTYSGGFAFATVRQNIPFGSTLTDFRSAEAYPSGDDFWLSTTQMGAGEGNANVSVAYFPFANGWIGGHLDPAGTLLFGNGVTQGNIAMNGTGDYQVSIPGVSDSTQDGLLFAIGGSNEDNIASTYALGGNSWQVSVRDNGNSAETDDVSFLYLPYTTTNLIAARVDGAT
ncbi:MAG: hypothetical protein KC561_19800, partial [Myxococcales bacterium]|nr:hypothetical protein [Myxococcales bacterium]